MTKTTPEFGEIALCLSGGGYRAAAFHLGTLTMLDELELLDNARYFSTASGGTIVAMKYIVDKINKVGFGVFAEKFTAFLSECNVVSAAFDNLTTTKCDVEGDDTISLIRAGAGIYRERLGLGGLTIKDLITDIDTNGTFHDLIFNSTEFHTGSGFRFRAKRKELASPKPDDPCADDDDDDDGEDEVAVLPPAAEPSGALSEETSGTPAAEESSDAPAAKEATPATAPAKAAGKPRMGRWYTFGNQNVRVKKDVWEQIELADVVAASSCFPGAFEPIRFPQDFRFVDRKTAAETFSGKTKDLTTVALMDGGIFDNQGLDEMMSGAGRRRPEVLPFDLVLVSDTTQWSDKLYSYEMPNRPGPLLGFRLVIWVLVLVLFAVIFSSLLLAKLISIEAGVMPVLQTVVGTVSALFSFLCAAGLLVLIGEGYARLKSLKISGYQFPIWSYLSSLRIGDIVALVRGRLESAKVMTFDVFMKRIRLQTMNKAMGDVFHTSRKNILEGNIAFGEIYGIARSQENAHKIHKLDPGLVPTQGMKEISKRASDVATALWLNEKEVADLVACGRITTCYALLSLIWKRRDRDARAACVAVEHQPEVPTDPKSPFHKNYTALKATWDDLKKEFP